MNFGYLLRRLIIAVGTLTVAVSLVFLVVHLVPGDPVVTMLGDAYTPEAGAQLRAQMRLDEPLWLQYVTFMGRLVAGDMGLSFITKQPVFKEVMANFGFTMQLALAGLIVSVLISLPIGILSGVNRGKTVDSLAMSGAILGVSMPSFWLGILLMILFAVKWKLFPLLGVGNPAQIGQVIMHLALPALTIGLRGAGLTARVTRSAMIETMNQDYVRTARAKGVSERTVIFRHGLRNALLPVITVVGLDLGRMLGGTTVVETVFSRPGMGTLLINAVLTRDYPMIQGAFLVYLSVVIVINLAVDLIYARMDPRIVYK